MTEKYVLTQMDIVMLLMTRRPTRDYVSLEDLDDPPNTKAIRSWGGTDVIKKVIGGSSL